MQNCRQFLILLAVYCRFREIPESFNPCQREHGSLLMTSLPWSNLCERLT
jgi:hypothetical protein